MTILPAGSSSAAAPGGTRQVASYSSTMIGLAPFRLASMMPKSAGQIIDLHRQDIADGAVVDPFDNLALRQVVTVAQSGNEGQFFLACFLDRLEHRADARSIDRDRFFAKDVLPRGDRRLEVQRTEMGRCRQQHDVDIALEDLLVGVEADEAAFRGNIDLGSQGRIGQKILQA